MPGPNENNEGRVIAEVTRLTEPPLPHPALSGDLPRPDSIREKVRSLDPTMREDSPQFQAAVFLLAALRVGQNTEKLAFWTALPRPEVSRFARRLLDNGVWQAGKTHSIWRYPDRLEGSFWLDVAVVLGSLCRRSTEEGVEWAPPGFWHRWYDSGAPNDAGSPSFYSDRSPQVERTPQWDPSHEERDEAMPLDPLLNPHARIKEGDPDAEVLRRLDPPRPARNVESPGTGPRNSTLSGDLFPGAAWLG